jgi:hypothetical protein
MPLKKGLGPKVISANIGEMMGSFKKTGKIGTSKPKSMKAAGKQASAIAYEAARKIKRKAIGRASGGEVRTVRKRDGDQPVKIY